ncbi:MAG: response regulator transcription factor [Bacilli bacterium]|nr:response regulator transcription factor [Bacilli bacterium]
MYTICLVEDEQSLSDLIKMYLEKEGYKVIQYFNGNDALANVDNNDISLWILDIMLGDDVNGYDIIKKIREKNSNVPVIFTSARDQDIDKIIGLEMGSDDYLAKPYSTKELILRVNKLISRIYKDNEPSKEIKYESYIVDLNKRVARENDKEIKLTTLEFDLLILFLNNKNRTFSREEILKSIWGEDYFGSDRAVDDLVRRLRKKMNKLNVSTIYGYGYRLS